MNGSLNVRVVTYWAKLIRSDGNTIRLENMATRRVTETSNPSERVPSNSLIANMRNPKKSTIEVYIMLTPVSRTAAKTAARMFQPLARSSCRYLAKKWMVSSTEIPNATENTKMVEGLMGMPVQPMTPAVKRSGSKLGMRAMPTIRALLNSNAITKAMTVMASVIEMARFLTR